MGSSSSKFSGAGYAPPALPNKVYTTEYLATLPSMAGKVVVVTGASSTDGLGWVCAKTLASKGATIVLLNRASDRAVNAEKKLKESVPSADVSTIDCDLSSFSSTQAAAAALKAKFSETGIDVLCNNAGVMALKDQATADGYDVQMQTNHLSHFLLTREVFPLLDKAAELRGEARVVHHSSGARSMGGALNAKYFGKNGGKLGGDSSSMFFGGARWTRYGQTKLANAVFTLALRDKLQTKGSKVKALCAAPGLAASQLQATTYSDGGMGSGTWFMSYAQSPEDGAVSLIECCARPGLKNGDCLEPSGMAHMVGKPGPFYPEREFMGPATPAARALLWTESEKAVGGKWDL